MHGMKPPLRENEVLDLMTHGTKPPQRAHSSHKEHGRIQFTTDLFCAPNSYSPYKPPLTRSLSLDYRWLSTFY